MYKNIEIYEEINVAKEKLKKLTDVKKLTDKEVVEQSLKLEKLFLLIMK